MYLPNRDIFIFAALCTVSIQLSFRVVSASPVILAPVVSNESCPTVLSDQREALKSHIKEVLHGPSTISDHCPCGDSSMQWTKVAHLNMSDPQEECPVNWTMGHRKSYRWCDMSTKDLDSCDSTFFELSPQQPYSHVCGKVIGYQRGSTDAFFANISNLERSYIDGASLTHGAAGSRQHIWSLVSAHSEDDGKYRRTCPCTDNDTDWDYQIPEFVGENYFCDTGASYVSPTKEAVLIEDPLWDGKGCGEWSTCCTFNNPPWFCKSLQHVTTDPIELRLCASSPAREASVINLIEIYVM